MRITIGDDFLALLAEALDPQGHDIAGNQEARRPAPGADPRRKRGLARAQRPLQQRDVARAQQLREPPPERAVIDQFARSKSTVANALMELGREIELIQRHKAEDDLAVAGASILARHEFVQKIAELSEKTGKTLPKGDRKSTRLNSSHKPISYAVFCLKKKKKTTTNT